MATKNATKSRRKTAIKAVLIILIIIAAIAVGVTIAGNHKSDAALIQKYETTNSYILDSTDISAHRSGGGIEPEESMLAFKNCVENASFSIDVFEFDLHITKDDVLVLLHDDTLDRTANVEEVFNEKEVRPEDKTYEELRQLNIGAKFVNENGEMPYAKLESVPDELKILRVEDVLDYLEAHGQYKYIIEIKNSEDLGRRGVDILHEILLDKGLMDRVIFGTFHEEISLYVDENYPDMTRSTGIKEALAFWKAALTDDENYIPPCTVLQLPYCSPYKNLGINTATAKVINYAHKHDMAVQYWTVNDEEDMEYLISLGADCIMSDYPDKLYEVKTGN